jgi:hypothetical protein
MYSNLFKKIVLLSVISGMPCGAMNPQPQPKSNPFDALSKKSEEGYQKSGTEKEAPAAQKSSAKNEPPKVEEKKGWLQRLIGSSPSESNPILAKHKKFSDDWWNALFDPCTGCEKLTKEYFKAHPMHDKNRPKIKCDKLLKNNVQWKEIEAMPREAKKIVMQQALERFYNNKSNGVCNLACALCAGDDPDERLDSKDDPHTALHVVSSVGPVPHYPLFLLLLEKGVDPKMECMPALPFNFVPNGWLDDLKKHEANREKQFVYSN